MAPSTSPVRWGRIYFAVQSLGGAAWWVGVFFVPGVREATLGSLQPLIVAAFDVPLFVVGSALAAAGIGWAAVVSAGWTVLVAIGLAAFATVTTEAGWGVVVMLAAAAGSGAAACAVVRGRIPTEWVIQGPFAFRVADARRPRSAHVAFTFVQVAGFWGLFLVVVPLIIVFFENRWMVGLAGAHPAVSTVAVALGMVVLALASALGVWSAVTMSTLGRGTPLPSAMPNSLVVAGPYRWVRNPMALAGIAQGVAVGLILTSWPVVAYALAGSLVWNLVVRPHEEADLEARFGEEFRRYRRAVRCWIPRIPSRTAREGVSA